MPVKVVSDLHSNFGALRREVAYEDTLLLLGDLVNIIDYTAMDGILVEIYGAEAVRSVVELRAERRFGEARSLIRRHREGREGEIAERFEGMIREAYKELDGSLPHQTYLILGNVDSPKLAKDLIRPGVEAADGRVIELEGLRVGFIGGGLPTPLQVAGEVPEEEFNATLEGLGTVDVVCSHVPPDLPELTYDTVARRRERGSSRLVDYVREVQPRAVLFGHVHQPLISSMHLGRTHLLNAGYFRRTGRALPLSL
ncbi:MAG: metallophosphoesterase family protein [Actinomycetota bacterium]